MSVRTRSSSGRLCICVGAGGVGKTTMAAAIALAPRGARRARRRRHDRPGAAARARARLRASSTASRGRSRAPGELWAMRLDPKRTLDELIASLAPDARHARARALEPHLPRAVGRGRRLAGVQRRREALRARPRRLFDAIVLDTPPSRNALDFLDAPGRLVRFFDGRALRLLLAQGGLATRVARARRLAAAGRPGRGCSGGDVLREISAFVTAIGSMIDGLAARAAAVAALLRDPATSFVLVSVAAARGGRGGDRVRGRARARAELPLAALVVNRVHGAPARRRRPSELEPLLGGAPRRARARAASPSCGSARGRRRSARSRGCATRSAALEPVARARARRARSTTSPGCARVARRTSATARRSSSETSPSVAQ